MQKAVIKFVVKFKSHTGREPITLSIQGGMVAAKLWGDREPSIMLKGRRIATSEIASVEPVTITGYFAAQRLKQGKAVSEEQFELAMAGKAPLPQLTDGKQ